MNEIQDKKQQNRLEVIGTLLVAAAALAVAWCSFQSSLWSGVQDIKIAESNFYSRQAQQKAFAVAHRQELDVAMAIEFVSAVVEKQQDRVDYYLTHKTELQGVLLAWMATKPLQNTQAPPHPLAMKQYTNMINAMLAQSDSITHKSHLSWDEAQHANTVGDRYTLVTVIFSTVMFLGAISNQLKQVPLRRMFLGLAGLIFVAGLVMMFILPVQR